MGYICYLGFFVVLDKLFWGKAVQVAQSGLHHDGNLAQVLFDDAFGNAIHRPTDICLVDKRRGSDYNTR